MSYRKLDFRTTAAALAAVVLTGPTFAAAPNLVNYQGRLTNSAGNPVADGSYSVNFTLYDAPTGGVPQWGETQSVTTSNGVFAVRLGSVVLFGADLFNDTSLYLALKVGTDPEISPRTRLTAVPYALSSGDGWTQEGATVHLTTNTDAVGIGTHSPIRPLHVSDPAGGLFVSRIESSNADATVTEISNTSSSSVWESAVAGANGIGFWGVQPGDMYFYKQGSSWPNVVLTSGGSLGLGTSIPRARLEAVTTDTVAGFFASNAPTSEAHVLRAEYTGTAAYDAAAVYGKSTPADYYGYGGRFRGGYVGVLGQAIQDGTNSYFGVYGEASGSGAGIKQGVRAWASGSGKNYGLYAIGGSATDTAFGVYAIASGNKSRGVVGLASGGTSLRGVYGKADGQFSAGGYFESDYVGVWSFGRAAGEYSTVFGGIFNASTTPGHIAYGLSADASGTGANVAISARAAGGTVNHAGEFDGDVLITGTLSKTAGSFTIDHPLDPANKYLQHSFVESPDMMNVYNGNVVLDGNGQAVVALPSYFQALNTDFRYQLTCIGGFAPVFVSQEITGNQFSIAGGTPGLKVSWMVTGVRQDAYAQLHRIQVELEKAGNDKGKYLHPKLFGAPLESAIGYVRPNGKPDSISITTSYQSDTK